jgi:hypothetical protein
LIEGGKMVSTYLNKPPVTKAKKTNAPANSNPATIFFLRATLRRGAGLRACRRGSSLEDRNFYYGAQMMEENSP